MERTMHADLIARLRQEAKEWDECGSPFKQADVIAALCREAADALARPEDGGITQALVQMARDNAFAEIEDFLFQQYHTSKPAADVLDALERHLRALKSPGDGNTPTTPRGSAEASGKPGTEARQCTASASECIPDDEEIRARFEKWAARQNLNLKRKGGNYAAPYTAWTWESFYAATIAQATLRAASPARFTELEELNRDMVAIAHKESILRRALNRITLDPLASEAAKGVAAVALSEAYPSAVPPIEVTPTTLELGRKVWTDKKVQRYVKGLKPNASSTTVRDKS